MYDDKKIVNVIGTFICALIVIFFATFVPYKIISSANNTVITQIDKIRFIGPLLLLIGIIGYLLCFLKFILDAKGRLCQEVVKSISWLRDSIGMSEIQSISHGILSYWGKFSFFSHWICFFTCSLG